MRFVPSYPKELWILAIGMFINITGASFLWPMNAIYMTQVLGQSLSTAGTVLMLHAGAGMLGNLLGGNLYDRIGGKRTVLLGVGLGTLSAFSLSLANEWHIYIALMIALGFGNGVVFPAIYAMAGWVWPEGRRKSFNAIYVFQNVGVACGTAIGGLVAQISFTYVFIVNGLTFLIFISIVWFGIQSHNATQLRDGEVTRETNASRPKHLGNGYLSLFILSLGFMACWMSYVQWQTSISVYMQELGFTLSSYSVLWTINGLIIILAQPFNAYITKVWIPSVKAQLATGVFIFIGALVLLSQTNVYSGFLIAMVIMTIGEIFIWPAVPTAAQDLAPIGRKGLYQGVVGSAATAGRMLGPLVGGYIFEIYHAQVLFYSMIAFCVLSMVSFMVYDLSFKSKHTTISREQQGEQSLSQ
ncbi:MDR family MFS transporter [Caldalkalibacillus salinus]|uniref:MDR family MFS transporter n=1 Tax=Caldalkalibacillus salinus TaxID=2803787 RepID=UPI0019241E8C|nr:MFS transporter [Caldalkalibacillus salinus]